MINIEVIYPDNIQDYVLLEMQGCLENNLESQSFNAIPLGDLIKIDETKYKFMIGIHDLIGSLITLKEPILVTKKVLMRNPDSQLDEQKIVVQGVCKSKILFSVRPTPVIDRLEKKTIQTNKEFPNRLFSLK